MRDARPKRAKPQALAETIRELRRDAQPATLLAAAQASWRSAVGEQIAAQAQPVRERDGMITVECSAATWAQELDLLHDELLASLNSELGEARIKRLRMVVGDGNVHDTF
jgi:predicted nucleic acid-binding Zn ribbon protein